MVFRSVELSGVVSVGVFGRMLVGMLVNLSDVSARLVKCVVDSTVLS